MISAHIYSNEALPRPQERAVRDGLEMVAEHIGERLVARHYRLVLPTSSEGLVDPYSYEAFPRADFDKNIDLHIIVARLAFADKADRGVAYVGSGIAFVAAGVGKKALTSTTAHEAAHSLDFVRNNEAQRRGNSLHCRCHNCIMRASFDHTSRRLEGFCSRCQSELADHGVEHLEELRQYRLRKRKLTIYN